MIFFAIINGELFAILMSDNGSKVLEWETETKDGTVKTTSLTKVIDLSVRHSGTIKLCADT